MSAARRGTTALASVAVVVLNAAIQAALVAVAPPLASSAVGLLTAAASAVALLAGAAILWLLPRRPAASADTTPAGASGPAFTDSSPPTGRVRIAWVVGSGVVCGVVAVVAPYLLPLTVAVACWVTAAAGLRAAGRLVARHPIRFALLTLLTIAAVVLVWLAALLLGLFVTGWPAAALTWLLAGAAAALLVPAWHHLALRPRRQA